VREPELINKDIRHGMDPYRLVPLPVADI